MEATAGALPFADGTFDASMATFTVHPWGDLRAGLAEMRRVTRGPVLILSCDPDRVRRFWRNDYAPLVLSTEARRYPALSQIGSALGGTVNVVPVPIPLDCKDGFHEAYHGRPGRLLDDRARRACSAWSFADRPTRAAYVDHLRRELAGGSWDARHARLRSQSAYDGSLALVVATR